MLTLVAVRACCWVCKHLKVDFGEAYGSGDPLYLYRCEKDNAFVMNPKKHTCGDFAINRELVEEVEKL